MPSSGRIWSEERWYALTGRVVDLRAEEDGDLHIALQDATGDKPGIVVVEIPAKPQWCELRKIVFGWTDVQFPFRVRSGRKLKLTQPPVITVIGKAFFDIGHANLAPRYEIPRAGNGYNFDWGGNLDGLAKLIWHLRKFRKGNRKRRKKRRKKRRNRVSLFDQFSRAVHRAARLATIDKIETLQEEIRRTSRPRLQNIDSSLSRLSRVRVAIARRLGSD